MDIITKDSIKQLFNKLEKINNQKQEFIYNAKTNTFGYADIKEIYYKGNSIFIGIQKEILKFQEYRLNLEIDLINKESNNNVPVKQEDIEYINELKIRVDKIKELSSDELVGISDEGDILENIDLYRKLSEIYSEITEEKTLEN
ncbi:MAG: hypothetical protein HFJ60_04305 [Clostridia bacterium]|jgi:hypothetical protein|nr:hypothetical protein [Clostridia bacterium]